MLNQFLSDMTLNLEMTLCKFILQVWEINRKQEQYETVAPYVVAMTLDSKLNILQVNFTKT